MDMGFSRNAAIRALTNNQDNVENASLWIYEHLEDADINSPLPKKEKQAQAPPDLVSQIMDFGYTPEQAQVSLLAHV